METTKREITNRKDVALLVRSFYSNVLDDDLLSPIFNKMIRTNEEWEQHFKTLTDFWETNLFLSASYQGNPLKSHIETDQKTGNSITQLHFSRWLNIWHKTVDDLFTGDRAWQAKNRARKMSTFMFLKIFENRKEREDKSE